MCSVKQLITAEELLAMPQDQPCELIEGRIVTRKYWPIMNGAIAVGIGSLLLSHADAEDLGTVVLATGFILDRNPDTVRSPALAFIAHDRIPGDSKGYFSGPPDLAVEVISPTDVLREVDLKTKAWLDAGTRMVWVVWPDTRSVVVHRRDKKPLILHEQDDISADDVLPGFSCKVSAFFK